jgi:hypothetical protein
MRLRRNSLCSMGRRNSGNWAQSKLAEAFWLHSLKANSSISRHNFDDLRHSVVVLLGTGFGAPSGSPRPLCHCERAK